MALIVGFVLFALLDPPIGVVALAVGAVVEVGEAVLWTRYLRRFPVRAGIEAMIGERAEVIEGCSPRGRVKVHGEIWNAVCAEPAAAGTLVEVRGVEGLTLTVAAAEDRSTPPGGR